MHASAAEPIRIVAAVIRDPAGRVLLVRKRGSDTFIQPGGKREPGEAALATLARELDEELGVAIAEAWPLGTFEDAAVHEPGCRVRAEAFAVRVHGTPAARAEIAEARWIDAAEVEHLLRKAMDVVPVERLWVNPDCGLKTRGWKETIEQLEVMMEVTKKLRAELAAK